MKEKYVSFILIYIILCLIESVKSKPNDEGFTEEMEKTENSVGKELKSFYDSEGIVFGIESEKYNHLLKTMDNYVKRYISLFLVASNLMNYNVEDLKEEVNVDLEFRILGQDLIFLQDYIKTHSLGSHIKDLSKLDMILSNMVKQKNKNFIDSTLKAAKIAVVMFVEQILRSGDVQHFLPLLVSLIVTWIIYYFSLSKSLYVLLGVLLNSLVFWEGIILYKKRLKEVDIEISYSTLKLKGIPEYCEQGNSMWYQSFTNYLFGDSCLKYYKDINKSAVEEVSFFQCMLDTYALYLVETPFRVLGSSVRKFSTEVLDNWGFPFNLILFWPVTATVVICVAVFLLVLCGKHFKLRFLGSSFEVGDTDAKLKLRQGSSAISQGPKVSQERKKLKPWTKARFPRRMDLEFVKRKKFLTKSIKPALENNVRNSNESSCENDDD